MFNMIGAVVLTFELYTKIWRIHCLCLSVHCHGERWRGLWLAMVITGD